MEFTAQLEKLNDVQVTFLTVPFLAMEVYGVKGRVNVKGTLDGLPYEGVIEPIGNGTHVMIVRNEQLKALRKSIGDTVTVFMERDVEERTVIVPDDFVYALEENPDSLANFEALSYSQQKAYVEWIESAKKAETRAARIQEAIARLAEGLKFR
jgi:hypothetical protein